MTPKNRIGVQRVRPKPAYFCGCSPTAETLDLKSRQCRFESNHPHHICRRSPIGRGASLRNWLVWVRVPLAAPVTPREVRVKSLHGVRFPVYGAGLHIKKQRSTCRVSSAGRAGALQALGREFKSLTLHHSSSVQLCQRRIRGKFYGVGTNPR